MAVDLIKNVAPGAGLRLQDDFGRVFAEGNEDNSEVLWTVQHTSNLPYNGPGNSSGHDNILNHLWVPKHDELDGMQRDVKSRPPVHPRSTDLLADGYGIQRKSDRYPLQKDLPGSLVKQ